MAKRSKSPIAGALERKIAAAKAAKGVTWQHISDAMKACGFELSSTNLMTKQHRNSFRADELIVLLRLLEVNTLELSDIDVDGLARGKSLLQGQEPG